MPLLAGLTASVALVVTDADTAIALRSGDVPVLGTPRLLALVEEASVKAVEGTLPAGHTTVGMRVQLDHLHPPGSARPWSPRPRWRRPRAAASPSR